MNDNPPRPERQSFAFEALTATLANTDLDLDDIAFLRWLLDRRAERLGGLDVKALPKSDIVAAQKPNR